MGEVNAVHQQGQLRAVQYRTQRVVMEDGQLEAALFQSLVRDDETAALPRQNLHAVSAPRNKDEEVSCVEVLLPVAPDNGAQPIDAVAHVDGLARQENPRRSRESQHRGYPSAANSSAKYRLSVPTPKRSTSPLRVPASMTLGAPARVEDAGQATTSTGRKAGRDLELGIEEPLRDLYR